MNENFNVPILFLIFNRPEKTQVVFNEIKKLRPKYLYVAADGPRAVTGEAEKCQEARIIIEQVDWDCEVKTLFRVANLGCGRAVSEAITWFFDGAEEGIILEDDCVPHPDFFGYCEVLLNRYRNNDRVMFIGGNNFQDGEKRGDASYYFSAYSHVWGWATWRSTWQKYRFNLVESSRGQFAGILPQYFRDSLAINYWKTMYAAMVHRRIDTWDYQLTFAIWLAGGVAIIPNINLVSNIGFGEDSAHTSDKNVNFENLASASILPLKHPEEIAIDVEADDYYNRKIKAINSPFFLLLLKLKFILPLLWYDGLKKIYLKLK